MTHQRSCCALPRNSQPCGPPHGWCHLREKGPSSNASRCKKNLAVCCCYLVVSHVILNKSCVRNLTYLHDLTTDCSSEERRARGGPPCPTQDIVVCSDRPCRNLPCHSKLEGCNDPSKKLLRAAKKLPALRPSAWLVSLKRKRTEL